MTIKEYVNNMKNLIKALDATCKEDNFNPDMLVDFLKSFFGDATLKNGLILVIPDNAIAVLILQKISPLRRFMWVS